MASLSCECIASVPPILPPCLPPAPAPPLPPAELPQGTEDEDAVLFSPGGPPEGAGVGRVGWGVCGGGGGCQGR